MSLLREQTRRDSVHRGDVIAHELVLRHRGRIGVGSGVKGNDGVRLSSEPLFDHRAQSLGRGWGQQLRALVGDGAEQQFRGVLLSCRDGLGRVSWQNPAVDHWAQPIGREFAANMRRDLRGRRVAKRRDRGRAKFGDQLLAPLPGGGKGVCGPRGAEYPAAFDDRAAKQSLRERRRHGIANVCPPGRLAKDRGPLRITAERGDIRLHPAQRGLLVQ